MSKRRPVRDAADTVNAVAAEIYDLIQRAKREGHLQLELDLTDNEALAKLGIDGVVRVKIKLP